MGAVLDFALGSRGESIPASVTNRVPISVRNLVAAALLVGATVVSYLPALSGEFIWNDSDYVTAPPLRSLRGLGRIWTDLGATEQYYPLLHSAFWVQHRLFGDRPFGYHLVTLLLHVASALLFAATLLRLFDGGTLRPVRPAATPGRPPEDKGFAGAWLAALLFALHPVHVESVAWIAEQKNTLSLVLYLGAALLYLRFDATRRPATHLAALGLFAASLACKTMTATLPAALLVILWWKRGRLAWRRDVLPLLPWLVLGAAAGLFSSWVEWAYGHAYGPEFGLSLLGRLLVAGRAVVFYAGKLIWPSGLNFVYPRWKIDPSVWWQWLFPLGVVAAGAALWGIRLRARGSLAAFLLFTGSLFPVLGFVNLYGARFSWVWDHWQYLPDLGPLALAGAGLAAGWRRLAWRVPGGEFALIAVLAAGLGAHTSAHSRIFHDDPTLYRATLARNPGCLMAHYNLAVIWSRTPGREPDAVAEYQAALRLDSNDADAHNNLGDLFLKMPGRLGDAISEYEVVLRLRPDTAKAHYNLGVALAHVPGRLDEAIAHLEQAVRLQPDFAEAHDNLGVALAHVPGRLEDAVAQFREAVRLQPMFAGAHNNLGLALSQLAGRRAEAVAEFETALRLQPEFAPAWYNLGATRYRMGELKAAEAAFRQVLQLSPDDLSARQALAVTLAEERRR